jgi:hypothetical protein
MNWKEQFDKQFRERETHWEGSPVEYTEEKWNAEHLSDLKKSDFYDFISTQIIERLIADIPEKISAEVGFVVKTPRLKQQLRDKWLGEDS